MEATPEQEHPPTTEPVVAPEIELPTLDSRAVESEPEPELEPGTGTGAGAGTGAALSTSPPIATPVTPPISSPVSSPVSSPTSTPENTAKIAAETAQTPAPNPIQTSVIIPAETQEGGEWQLLLAKLNDWLGGAKAAELWGQSKGPLKALGLAIVALLLLRLLGAVLGTLDALPLVPGLLELVGLLWLALAAGPRLLRSEERKKLLTTTHHAWKSFSGRG